MAHRQHSVYATFELLTLRLKDVTFELDLLENDSILQSHLESLLELEELEKEEDQNVTILRSISLSLLSIYSKLKPSSWLESSRTLLQTLKQTDPIRTGFYQSRLDTLPS